MLSELIKISSSDHKVVPRYRTRFGESPHMTIHPFVLEYPDRSNRCLMTNRFPYQNHNMDTPLILF